MSWFTNFFRNIFGHHGGTEPASTYQGHVPPRPLPPRPTDSIPAGGVAPDVQAVRPQAPINPRDMTTPPGYVKFGNDLVPAPYGVNDEGQPFLTQQDADTYRDKLAEQKRNQQQWQDDYNVEVYKGPVPVESLTPEEKAFLAYATNNFNLHYTQLFYAVCSGRKIDIDNARAWAEAHYHEYDAATYQGRMRGLVDQFAMGSLRPKY